MEELNQTLRSLHAQTLKDGSPRGKYAKPIEQLKNITAFVSANDWFDRYVDRSGDCWVWMRSTCGNGYGKMTLPGGTRIMTHRFAYQRYIGPIPKGMLVCHKCDNKICCNPDHLFIGTYKDNIHDALRKGRFRVADHHGEGNPAAKLTNGDVLKIRASTERTAILAQRYGVSMLAIQSVRSRRTWTHL